MKRTAFYGIFLMATMFTVAAVAQDGKDKSKRPSPPATEVGGIDGVTIKILYSTPSAKGRKMLGGTEPYGTVWRTGANETTSIEFSDAVKVEGKELPKGKYALFTIPGENEWTIIFNKTIKWGAFDYKESEDVLRVKVKPTKTDKFVETFNIAIEKDHIVLKWENTRVEFKVSR